MKFGEAKMTYRGFWVLILASVAIVLINVLLPGDKETVSGLGRQFSWLLTAGIFILLLAYIGYAVKGRWDGIFVDDRNRISLSRFQLVLWTVLLVSALMTVGVSNSMLGPNPLQVKIPPEIWALLGIGVFTAVAAPVLVESRKKDATPPEVAVVNQVRAKVAQEDSVDPVKIVQLDVNVPAKTVVEEARWMDLIRGDTTAGFEHVDVSKVQQLAFTIVLVSIYAMAVFGILDIPEKQKMAVISTFPPIDPGFVSLLGLSHAAYLANKKAAT
jgi:hypothetical protein